MSKKITIITLLIAFAVTTFAQLPDCDIWMFDITQNAAGFQFSNATNITNRPGYDNQPAFSPDGKYILYTSIRGDGQADIYKYDIETKKTTQFTFTKESEYSPTFMPDGKSISTVRVEKDSTQRLWKFPIAGGEPSIAVQKVDSVGYHVWLGKDSIAFFILTNPPSLQLVNTKTQKTTLISDSIGRCMQLIPSGLGMSFTHKIAGGHVAILQMNRGDRKVGSLNQCSGKCILPQGTEDYVWYNATTLFTASGSELFRNCKNCSMGEWTSLTNFKKNGINHITRMAVNASGTKLLVVATAN